MENNRKNDLPLSKFADNFYLVIGIFFAFCFSLFLISVGKAWISLIISGIITWFSFHNVKESNKKAGWIILIIISIIADIINIIATAQLIFEVYQYMV